MVWGLLVRTLAMGVALALLSQGAEAHPGGGIAGGFLSGVLHPITGWDHVIAMVAVGLWGAFLGRPAIWVLPVVFPLVMAFGGAMGVLGIGACRPFGERTKSSFASWQLTAPKRDESMLGPQICRRPTSPKVSFRAVSIWRIQGRPVISRDIEDNDKHHGNRRQHDCHKSMKAENHDNQHDRHD